MENGRFGPIETNDKPKKTYRVDYNRLITFAMILVIVVLGVFIWMDAKKEPKESANFPLDNTLSSGSPNTNIGNNPDPVLSPEELRPLPEEEGMLPIFRIANTNEKKVAIVVDSFEKTEYLETLIGLCGTFSAKVTLFPTGNELLMDPSVWATAAFAGHEIENHTMDNTRMSTLMDEDKVKLIDDQTAVVRMVIGEGYTPHFLTTSNLEDDDDLFLHSWLAGSNYMGIVRWDENMPKSFDLVRPGAILRYPLTEAGLKSLSQAIPVLAENGYQMVTVNELFAYPDNFGDTADTAG